MLIGMRLIVPQDRPEIKSLLGGTGSSLTHPHYHVFELDQRIKRFIAASGIEDPMRSCSAVSMFFFFVNIMSTINKSMNS